MGFWNIRLGILGVRVIDQRELGILRVWVL